VDVKLHELTSALKEVVRAFSRPGRFSPGKSQVAILQEAGFNNCTNINNNNRLQYNNIQNKATTENIRNEHS
jgi:hypothetical protein